VLELPLPGGWWGWTLNPLSSLERPPYSAKFQPPSGGRRKPPSSLAINDLLLITHPLSTTMHPICLWIFNLALNNLQNRPFKNQKSKIWGRRLLPLPWWIEEGPLPTPPTHVCLDSTAYGARPPSCFWIIRAAPKAYYAAPQVSEYWWPRRRKDLFNNKKSSFFTLSPSFPIELTGSWRSLSNPMRLDDWPLFECWDCW